MLQKLKSIAKKSRQRWFPSPDLLTTVSFAGHSILLDEKWYHEREYLNFIRKGTISGALGMDLWVFSHFVQPGDCVLDAGANIGLTALLAELAGAGEIHSFEPDPRLIPQLIANTKSSTKIHIHPKALGTKQGQLELCISQSHNQGSTFSKTHLNLFPHVYEQSTTEMVEVESINEVFFDTQFQLLKIDVEGAEHDVLLGAEKHLRSYRPGTVYVELYNEYLPPVDHLLKEYYRFAYRIVCRQDGFGKLVDSSVDVSCQAEQGLIVMPPSYIYTNTEQHQLTDDWTESRLSKIR